MKESKATTDAKDIIAKRIFGMSISEGHSKRVCIRCKRDIKEVMTSSKYMNAGLCDDCYYIHNSPREGD